MRPWVWVDGMAASRALLTVLVNKNLCTTKPHKILWKTTAAVEMKAKEYPVTHPRKILQDTREV